MIDRIKEILEKEHLSPARFADLIQVQRSAVSHILTGRNRPSLDFVIKVLNAFPKLSTDWLLYGKQPMYNQEASEHEEGTNSAIEPAENSLFPTDRRDVPKNVQDGALKSNEIVPFSTEKQLLEAKKEISKIIVFYTDGTFDSFGLEKNSKFPH